MFPVRSAQLSLLFVFFLKQGGVNIHLPSIHDRVRAPVILPTRSVELTGSITDSSKRPLSGVTISASRIEENGLPGLPESETRSDIKGNYSFPPLIVGRYKICAQVENYRQSCTSRVLPMARNKVNFKLQRRAN